MNINYEELDFKILYTLLNNKKHALDFATNLNHNLFSGDLFVFSKLILDHVKFFKEIPTESILLDKVRDNNDKIEYIKTILESLSTFNYDIKEYSYDLKKLKDRYSKKKLLLLSENLKNVDDLDKALAEVSKETTSVKNLYKQRAYKSCTLKSDIDDFKNRLIAKIKSPELFKGMSTGYRFLDDSTGGLRKKELFIIGGESSSGKSMLLANMAVNMWIGSNTIDTIDNYSKGHNILYFSLEMPFEPCQNRVYSKLGNIASKGIRDGRLDKEGKSALAKCLKFTKNYPYEFEIVDVPRGTTIDTMNNIFQEAKDRYEPEIVVIDYLTLMGGNENEDDWIKLGKISEEIHEFAKTNDVLVLTAVQLNRMQGGPKKDGDGSVGHHRIGRSKLILDNANIFLQIETRKNEKMQPDMLVHLIKNREGELVSGTLLKNFENSTLADLSSFGTNENEDLSMQLDNIESIEEEDLDDN